VCAAQVTCDLFVIAKFLFVFFTIAEQGIVGHTITSQIVPYLVKYTDKIMYPQHFGTDTMDIPIWIQINPKIWIQTLDHFVSNYGIGGGLHSLTECSCYNYYYYYENWSDTI